MRDNAATIAPARLNRTDLVALVALTLGVSAIYGARLNVQPLVGEETRWATGAREMLASGDWIVPRQQGRVFPERPPMTMWMMAVAGWLRGDVDPIAIRLPSVIAVVLTSLLVYGYTRAFAPTFAATTAALAYATMGQVLQIGRQGESEALFALLVSASLLVWHLGYIRGWRPLVVWTSGFALAGLAALVKGPQAPVYFVAITATYLAVRRDWRYLISWQFAAGAIVFAMIVAAWQIPFYLATDWVTVVATWSGLAADRFHFSGALKHAVTYPLETFVCLLPWSPILVALAKRETRALLLPLPLGEGRGEGVWPRNCAPSPCPLPRGEGVRCVATFLFTALLVAYPTVWLAAGARGRYFMPLYPLIAVLVGLVIDCCSVAQCGSYPRRAWHQFVLLWGSLIAASGLLVGAAGALASEPTARFYQPRWFGIVFTLFAAAAAYLLWNSYRRAHKFQPIVAIVAVAATAGIAASGIMINVNAARWKDPTASVADLRGQLPPEAAIVSFSPIEHRFAYYFRDSIAELDWPQKADDLPPGIDYFCFMRQPGDTAEARAAGRGRTWYKTPGTLPFAWEEIISICVERQVYDDNPRTVVLGRVVRPIRAAVSDVTVPHSSTASKTPGTQRR